VPNNKDATLQDQRPDPEKLLRQIQAEEKQSTSAKLKLFFGPYPGVGKTYAMLEAARERKREGVDVVVGIVETHGRPETTALVKDLEILPRKEIPYKGVTLKEFDLDAALKRKPEIILIDELAHSNPPESRHAKRWQDVEELLNEGISVYTTLNVQHWESLNDVVAQITGIKVRETVPDSFLEKAHEVELVDLPPADLLKRLSEGKVYMGDQAIRAAENFFQTGNLIALRELALRHTAERVDAEMQEFKNRYAITKVLPVRDRLLVGITASPNSRRLIRATLRLATSLRCEWITVYVQTPEHEKLPPDQKARIIDTLRLAERLGGETAVITGQNVPEELLTYARDRNVTKIVLGKPSRPRWKELLSGSTVNEIARRSGDVDLYVISAENLPDEKIARYNRAEEPAKNRGIWISLLLVALCTVLGWSLLAYFDRANLVMSYLLVVVWISYIYGRRAGIVASVASVLCFDFFLVPPYLTFRVTDTEYVITFVVMLAVSLFISTITGRLGSLTQTTRGREHRLRTLYKLSRTLSEIPEPMAMLQAAAEQLHDFYRMPVVILTPDSSNRLRVSAGDPDKFEFAGNEVQAAQWVFRNEEFAGRGTDTLAGSKGTYIPLRGREKTVGVLGIRLEQESNLIDPEQLRLIETFAVVIGSALESKELSEEAGKATASMEAERLRNLVLRSFSFDLAAPSQEISEIASHLTNSSDLSQPKVHEAIQSIRENSEQIYKVASNLPHYLEEAIPEVSSTIHHPVEKKQIENVPLSEYLSSERIRFFSVEIPKREILKSLIQSLELTNEAEALQLLEEREEVGGILIKPNVAIPHTSIDGISGVKVALGIQQERDGKPFFWLVFVSGNDSIREHLEFLKSAAQTLTDDVLNELSNANTSAKAMRILSTNAG
jgi:two-component system sensor histidine kinase KdpD